MRSPRSPMPPDGDTDVPDPPPWIERPGRSPANRSLERGIEILRAFRPGADLLGNGEIAERTGLSRPTVTRLTQTLVGAGMLRQEPRRRGYRLAPAVLSLAHAMRSGSTVLRVALPLMRELAQARQINVGLAVADRDEMVYLESIRYSRRVAFRNVVSGQRVPMELTSLGRAYLASTDARQRDALLGRLRARKGARWPALRREIERAMAQVRLQGWCSASWQPGVVALATPLPTPEGLHVLNISVTGTQSIADVERDLAPALLELRTAIDAALEREVDVQ